MNAIIPESFEPAPLEIDPRPCELCGLTVDRHDIVDDGEGPLFFCADISPDDMTLDELERRAELIRREEAFATLARWEAMDADLDARRAPLAPRIPEPYRPAPTTIAAFWFLVGLAEPERLAGWLRNHPSDAPTLLKQLEGACS